MSESKETDHVELKRKSKKIKKTYNLLDFVVVKQKNKKTQQITRPKVFKQIQKRGKIRRKKITTIKKRILKERNAKHSDINSSESIANETAEVIIDKIAQLKLENCQPEPAEAIIDKIAPRIAQLKLENCQPESAMIEEPKVKSVHSRNFREYCNHFITNDIKKLTELVLKDLLKFQENKFQQNSVKAKANKRYVVGFKEVKKFLIVKRLKLIVIAPDLERNPEVDVLVEEIKSFADQHNIPYVFSIKRRHIGYLLLKKVPVSLVGIFDYQGTTENVNELLKHVHQERINYVKSTVL